MSSRRIRSRQFTDEELIDLVSKLQSMLPETRNRSGDRATTGKVLQDTCNYIRSLQREVDDLSERLSGLLATTEISSSQAAMIRSFLMQY